MNKNQQHFLNLINQLSWDNIPHGLQESITYMLRGGKKVRPQLVYAAAKDLGLTDKNVDHIAMAIEMMHIATLIHDDMPCMDNDSQRHGKPSCHAAYGDTVSLLTGDALQMLSFEQLCTPHASPELFKEFTQAVGPRGLLRGQFLDSMNMVESETILSMYSAKSGGLFSCCLTLPAINNHQYEHVKTLRKVGQLFGILYQIQDDHTEQHVIPLSGESRQTASELLQDSIDHTRQMLKASIDDALDDINFPHTHAVMQELITITQK